MSDAIQVAIVAASASTLTALCSIASTWLAHRNTRAILVPKLVEIHELTNSNMAAAKQEIGELKLKIIALEALVEAAVYIPPIPPKKS